MQVKLTSQAAVAKVGKLKSGPNAGQPNYSVTFWAYGEDGVPSQFAFNDLGSEAAQKEMLAKVGRGNVVTVNLVPRDLVFLNPSDLLAAHPAGK